ncbi:MAG: carboxymuconolactone decarboxylase family protein [Erysipelotrichaceae bacterium]|nr:carboxymuconolactone decarboxylase family protein [Erysipelotrichaceae bacterium]
MYKDNAKKLHERMFPGFELNENDPDYEYSVRYENWAYDEVVNANDLDERHRTLAILATCMGAMAVDEFGVIIPAAVREFGVKPEEIKELVYQGTAYLGIARVFPFSMKTNEVFRQLGIEESKESRLTNTDENRQETGTAAQVAIFGEGMKDFWKGGTVNYWLASNCFGDYYTRKGLNLADREMITFCFLLAQGGCEPQLRSHIQGNINVGNDTAFLRKVVEQMIPYIGYPRSLNAFACIAEFEK